MARYLDPKNDLTFKRVFGEHPDLLIGFLNSVMPLSSDRLIREVEYLPAEQVPDIAGKKNSLVDVKCKDKSGRVFIIEMQMLWTDDFTNRIVFNASKAYVRQLDKSESYHLLQPVYTLAILNGNFDHGSEQFYHHYAIVNKENTDEVIEGLEFVLIELKKFKPEKWGERKIAALWLRFLKEVDERMISLPAELAENEQILKAAELCLEGGFTPEELFVYEAYWDWVRTEKTIREGSEARGLAKGLAEGKTERDQLEIERDQLEAERDQLEVERNQLEAERDQLETERNQLKAEKEKDQENMVLNSSKAGLSVETISAITGLLPEQIHEILNR